MDALSDIAPAFVTMAHRIVWAAVASVDRRGRPRSRILHPMWVWDNTLTGWIATSPTSIKRAHLGHSPFLSVTYCGENTDTCTAECTAEWVFDDAGRIEVWNRFKTAPAPVGYDPAMIPPWAGGPTSPEFAALRLVPWRLRVMPGTVLTGQGGSLLTWKAP
jgi:hypothetical protein